MILRHHRQFARYVELNVVVYSIYLLSNYV